MAAVPAAGPALLPLGMLLALGVIWGLSFPVAKIAAKYGVPALGYVAWQTLGAGAILLIVCLLRGTPPRLSWKSCRYYAFSGFYGIAFPNVVLQLAIAEMPAGIAAIIVNTTSLLTYGLALAFAMERFRWLHLTGLGCGFAGALLLLLPKASLPTPEMAGWVAFGFITPFSYAIANIFNTRHRPASDGSLAIACGTLFGAACWVVPMALAFDQFHAVGSPLGAGDAAILAQVLISSIAYILVFEVLRLAGAVYFSQVGYIVALTALGWGMLFFGERHSAWIWAAMALIFAGLFLVNRRRIAAAG
ncbi:MAG: DMT family transporter [Dongiaceae bacterium]